MYYFTPIYFVCLAVPSFKTYLFRLFGYRGDTRFTTYPDTWLRDLPLLDFGPGAYLSNRATIGTNVVLNSGNLLVAGIAVGERGLVGHLAMLAPGVQLQDQAEVGVGAALGLTVRLDAQSKVQPCCAINHGVHIGRAATVGSHTYIGPATVIGDGIRLRPGSVVPRGLEIKTQDEADQLFSAEGQMLRALRDELSLLLSQRDGGGEANCEAVQCEHHTSWQDGPSQALAA